MKFMIKAKGILWGFVTGVIVTVAVPAVASQIQKNIDVSYRDIKIYADGKLVNTNEDNEAFIYNGTTYLPVRAVGEAFNKKVTWNGETSSIYLGTQPITSIYPVVSVTPNGGTVSPGQYVTIKIDTNGGNLDHMQYQWDLDAPVLKTRPTVEVPVPVTPGPHYLYVTATNSDGNRTVGTIKDHWVKFTFNVIEANAIQSSETMSKLK